MKGMRARSPVVACIAAVLVYALVLLPISSELWAATGPTLWLQASQDACAAAKAQAQADVNGATWFAIGCLGGVLGWIIAYVIESNPPATALVGKSPDYVAQYTDCYRIEAKRIRSKHALNGCLAATGLELVLYLLLVVAASSE
jgi:hypothetical protein